MILVCHGLDRDGVSLVSPVDPSFDEIARPLIGSLADRVLKMKPMMVIVENASERTIVAVSLTWRVSRSVGGLVHRTNSVFPHVVCGDQAIARMRAGVRPGEKHVVAAGCVVESLDDVAAESDGWIEHFVAARDRAVDGAAEMAVHLDAVIFDDGRLVGLDQDAWLSDLFGTYVAEKQEWYRVIIRALEAGKSVDEAYAPIGEFNVDAHRHMMAGGRPGRPDVRMMWRIQAASEAQGWRSRYPDAEIATRLEGIRLEPFVIRRLF